MRYINLLLLQLTLLVISIFTTPLVYSADNFIHIAQVTLTNDDKSHTVEPSANVCQHPQQQTKLHTAQSTCFSHSVSKNLHP